MARARSSAMTTMRACGWGERTMAAWAWPGSAKSSLKRPRPRSSRSSSARRTGCPMGLRASPVFSDLLLPRNFHRREAFDHRHDDARVLLAEARRERRLLVALGHVREADGDVELLGDRVERVKVLVHERHLEAGLEVARDQRLRDALERLAAAAARLRDLVDH